jgi:ribulose kinase
MNASAHSDDQHVVGVDFGTLSGRAVVVRVSDGADLGIGVHEHADAVPAGPRVLMRG